MPTDPIILRYPTLFDTASAPLHSAMGLGLQIPDAWRDTIEHLCQRLLPLADTAKAQGVDFKILQVKSKFGSLRIAYRGGTPEIEAAIEEAKAEALLL